VIAPYKQARTQEHGKMAPSLRLASEIRPGGIARRSFSVTTFSPRTSPGLHSGNKPVLALVQSHTDHQSNTDADTDKHAHNHHTYCHVSLAEFFGDPESADHSVEHGATEPHEEQRHQTTNEGVDEIQDDWIQNIGHF
jgi:hypothetical protein